jgi:hypothetical protein
MELCADSSLKDEQLLIRAYLRKPKNTNMAGCWNFKFTFCFTETTLESLHLHRWSFVQWTIIDIPTSFTWIIHFIDGFLKISVVRNFAIMLLQTLNKIAKNSIFCALPYVCELFILLLLNFVQYMCFQLVWQRHNSDVAEAFQDFFFKLRMFWILELPTRRPKNTRGYMKV